MYRIKNCLFFFLLVLFCKFLSFSQTENTTTKKDYLKWKNIQLPDSTRAQAGISYVYNNRNLPKDSCFSLANSILQFTKDKHLKKQEGRILSLLGLLYWEYDDDKNAVLHLQKSNAICTKINDIECQANNLTRTGLLYNSDYNFRGAILKYKASLALVKTIHSPKIKFANYNSLGITYGNIFQADSSLFYLKKALQIAKEEGLSGSEADAYNSIGYAYSQNKDYKTAQEYFLKAISIFLKHNNTKALANAYFDLAGFYFNQNKFKESKLYAEKSMQLGKKIKDNNLMRKNSFYLYKANKHYKNYQEALRNYESYFDVNETKKILERNQRLLALELENKTIKDSLQQVHLKMKHQEEVAKKNIETQNLAFGWFTSILLLSFISYTIYKNTKQKQQKAVQEKQLEVEKFSTLLKNQELKSIDAMLEGQEKERQRIANELHDDLGGLIATLKLFVTNIKENQSEELIEKTDSLIDEVYNKVRNLSHAKNAGLMAKDGLFKTVEEMANTLSNLKNITINTSLNGVNERIDNTVELVAFRITQELLTNALKHAEASEISIQLNNHNHKLYITIEDNGKGFNPNNYPSNGIGLKNIKKRIAYYNGTININSTPNFGTTILIELPTTTTAMAS